jgi:hypothetical protein
MDTVYTSTAARATAEPSRKKTRRRRAHRARSRTAPPARHVVSRRNFPSIRTDFPLLATAGTREARRTGSHVKRGRVCRHFVDDHALHFSRELRRVDFLDGMRVFFIHGRRPAHTQQVLVVVSQGRLAW